MVLRIEVMRRQAYPKSAWNALGIGRRTAGRKLTSNSGQRTLNPVRKSVQKVVLFDIDGTMLLAGGAGKRAFFASIEAILGPLPADTEFDPRGRTDPALFDLAAQAAIGRRMTDAERAEVTAFFLARFPEELARTPSFRVFPGVLELIRLLALDEHRPAQAAPCRT